MRILYRIERLDPFLSCSLGFPAFPLSLHLLDVCTVGEHDLTQLYRRRGGKYLSLESIANQIGYPSRMIDMGMSKKYVIDGCCIERQFNTCLFLVIALGETTIDKQILAVAFHHRATAGHLLCCSKECYVHKRSFSAS
ncbi:hypothetical protein SDC9_182280 [bioreactor metagenome]|uniref:Uncharacterized protein n=1 Tax=bioreactor metagenome TaxID=1076179 RepID=A0A645H8F6_9ZZZZ